MDNPTHVVEVVEQDDCYLIRIWLHKPEFERKDANHLMEHLKKLIPVIRRYLL